MTTVMQRMAKKAYSGKMATRAASSSSSSGETIYSGLFSSRIKWLRRLSLGSSIASASALPLLNVLDIPLRVSATGAVAIFGTAFVTSFSSTIFLHFLTSPYITALRVMDMDKGLLHATRVNMIGGSIESEFNLKDCAKVNSSIHPFASFVVEIESGKKDYYYVYGQRDPLSKDPKAKEIIRLLGND